MLDQLEHLWWSQTLDGCIFEKGQSCKLKQVIQEKKKVLKT